MSKRVAITIDSLDGLNATLDPRFGRAFAFLIVNSESREVIAQIENESAQAAHGAGTGASALMSSNKVDVVISGRFGPKASQALEQFGIEMRVSPEGVTAADALNKLSSGELELMKIKVY